MNDDRRLYPRVDCQIPAELELFNGLTLDVEIINLSQSGLQIRGDEQLFELRSYTRTGPIEVRIHFGLADQPIHCQCRVIYKRREGQHRASAGLSLLSLADDQRARITQLITELNQEPSHSGI